MISSESTTIGVGVEEYHKSFEQNTSMEKSPKRTVKTQKTHVFASLIVHKTGALQI